MREFKRLISSWGFKSLLNKKKDQKQQLAEALNLLAPSKPSLLKSQQTLVTNREKVEGSKRLNELLNLQLPKTNKPEVTIHFDNLLKGLTMVNNRNYLELERNQVLQLIKRASKEEELKSIFDKFYFSGKLSKSLAIEIVLNRNFKDINFILSKINRNNRNSYLYWSDLQFWEFNLILLKKFQDLKQTSLIIHDLNSNSEAYLKLIQEGLLKPFYERIFYKFYFQYNGKGSELEIATQFSRNSSSILVWESSAIKQSECLADEILGSDHLTPLQQVFFKGISGLDSNLVANFKKISISKKFSGSSDWNEKKELLFIVDTKNLVSKLCNESVGSSESLRLFEHDLSILENSIIYHSYSIGELSVV